MIIWKFGMFDRLVIKNWRLMRENLYQDINTGDLKWKRVKINGKKR